MSGNEGQEASQDVYALVMDEHLAKNEYPKEKMERMRKSNNPPMFVKYMDEQNFLKLKDLKSPSGWTIARAINTGVMNPDSLIGCHAGDKESYDIFGPDFFYPIIKEYHSGFDVSKDRHVVDMDESKIKVELNESAKKKIVSSRIRVARNLKAFPLNTSGTLETRIEISNLMKKVFAELEGEFEGEFLLHSEMTPEQEQQLIDDHFLFRGKDRKQAASGYHQHFPLGRGIFLANGKKFLLWINEGDHLRLISMESGSDVKGVLSRLRKGIEAIESQVQKQSQQKEVFMKDDVLGMITCCPTNIGSGMRASVHILLPNLMRVIGFEAINALCQERNACQARGSSGEHSEVIDRVDISNNTRLGVSEWKLIQNMIECVNFLAYLEDELSNKPSRRE